MSISEIASSPRSSLTVRLMPSSATDPFSTTKGSSSRGISTATRIASPACSRLRMRPTPSTCPSTMCPPRRSPSASGRSRLTASPGRRSDSVVRRSVSTETSAEKPPLLRSTTVRQAPSTAMLAPCSRSASGSRVRTLRRAPPPGTDATSAMVPTSSTSPVNTPRFYPSGLAVTSRSSPSRLLSTMRRARGPIHPGWPVESGPGRGSLAGQFGRQEEVHLVPQPALEEAAVDASAALDHHRRQSPACQAAEQVLQVDAAGSIGAAADDPGARALERLHARGRRAQGAGDQRGSRGALQEQSRGGRQPRGRVHHHPHRSRGATPAAARDPPAAARGRRAVRRGSSASAVPTPISTASISSRSTCTSKRDSRPLTQRESPVRVASFPSSVIAALSITQGSLRVMNLNHISLPRRKRRGARRRRRGCPPPAGAGCHVRGRGGSDRRFRPPRGARRRRAPPRCTAASGRGGRTVRALT